MRRKGRLLLGLIATLALVAAPAAHAAFPGDNGRIGFVSSRQGPFKVLTMNPDGTNPLALTSGANNDAYPAWSPDGRTMAFTRFHPPDGDADIYTIRSDGTQLTRLTTGPPSEFEPAWSPDGQTLLFTKVQAGGKTDIVSMPSQGGVPINLTSTPFDDERSAAWSPDGSQIAYAGYTESNGAHAVSVMDSNGTNRLQVSQPGPLSDHQPDWSPDGAKLVFWRHHCTHSCQKSGGQILVVNPDGTGEQGLMPPYSNSEDPAWSPDGTRIAFAKDLGEEFSSNDEIFTMASDGSDQVRLTNDPLPPPFESAPLDMAPTWQAPPPPFERPASAASARASLVPDYRQTISATQCAARGGESSSHGAPLAFFSCDPPFFLPGPAAFFGPASSSWAEYGVVRGDTNAINGDQADVTLRASLTDIEDSAGSDYPAEVTLATKLRVTDRFNGASQTSPATMIDFDYRTPVACVSTVGPEGATCNLDTTPDATTPDTIRENKITVMQLFRFRVIDSGANGLRGDSDDRSFATQGIYIP